MYLAPTNNELPPVASYVHNRRCLYLLIGTLPTELFSDPAFQAIVEAQSLRFVAELLTHIKR